jgi:SAM-dependent methyltransferase
MTSFDAYAEDYEAALNRGIAVSGESKDYFAVGRMEWLASCLKRMNFLPRRVLDFGCGTGTSTPLFFEILGAESVVGVDPSESSLRVAREAYRALPATFQRTDEYQPRGDIDLAFCNGVFHHIPVDERQDAAKYVADAVRPDGIFAMWENNPWSPAARYVMSRIPFDHDAIMVWPGGARKLGRQAGLSVVSTDFAFVFPRSLKALRFIEPFVRRLPAGAQYQVLSMKK